MKGRTIAVAVLAVTLAVAASAAASVSGPRQAAAKSITVWLQVDAQAANWAPIVAAANSQFEQSHPGVTGNVQYQTLVTHLQKFDPTLAGRSTPDDITMGTP